MEDQGRILWHKEDTNSNKNENVPKSEEKSITVSYEMSINTSLQNVDK